MSDISMLDVDETAVRSKSAVARESDRVISANRRLAANLDHARAQLARVTTLLHAADDECRRLRKQVIQLTEARDRALQLSAWGGPRPRSYDGARI